MKLSLTGIMAGVFLILAPLTGSLPTASAQGTNLALTATATNSSSWEDGTDFDATKANDGDPNTRWNARGNDAAGSWVALNWANDVTLNKVAIDEDFNRVREFELQVPNAAGDDWTTVYSSAGTNINPSGSGTPTYTVLFTTPVTTKGLRFLVTKTTTVPSIFEIRVYNVTLGTLSGKVTDAQGQAIAGADVAVANGGSATTDAQGNYSLAVEAGTFDVTASKSGAFRARTARNVTLAADATTTQNFTLVPLPPNLALTATASSSSDYSPDYDASKANDGDLGTRWNSNGGDQNGAWIELVWDTEQEFNTIVIRESLGRIADYTIQKFDDATSDYVDIINQKPGALPTDADRILTTILPTAIKAKDIRILINEARSLPTIYEIEVNKAATGTLNGQVKDVTTGNSVGGATVTIDPFGNVTTDAQGNFSATVLPNEYLVRATAEGYFESDWQVVSVDAGAPASVTLSIPAKGPNFALDATASASSESDTNPVANIKDGDATTTWKPGVSEDTGDPLTTNQWVALTWDQPKTFNVLSIDWGSLYPIVQKSNFQTMDANGQWVDVPNTVFNPETVYVSGKPARFVLNPPLTTKGVRYFMNFTNGVKNVPEVPELQVYNSPIGGGVVLPACKGDANSDKAVDVNDAVAILRNIVGIGDPLSGQNLTNANVNGDAGVDVNDAVGVLQAIVGIANGLNISLTCG